MTPGRRRVDVNIEELDRVLDGARETPLSEADCEKVKTALHALAAMLVRPRNTEKTNAVLPKSEDPVKDAGPQPNESSTPPAKGHGRNGAEAFSGAQKTEIKHQNLKHGDRCPDCKQAASSKSRTPAAVVGSQRWLSIDQESQACQVLSGCRVHPSHAAHYEQLPSELILIQIRDSRGLLMLPQTLNESQPC